MPLVAHAPRWRRFWEVAAAALFLAALVTTLQLYRQYQVRQQRLNTRLEWALLEGTPRTLTQVGMLVQQGANVNAQAPSTSQKGLETVTPLMRAAQHGDADLVADLLRRGADPSFQNTHGYTALHFAAASTPSTRRGRPRVVELLLRAGADVNARDVDGVTPLVWAAGSADPALMQLLLKRGAQVNAPDAYGGTVLRRTRVLFRSLETRMARDRRLRTPPRQQELQRFRQVLRLLEAAGAKE